MRQFVAYANANKQSNKIYPYLIDVQSNLLEDLKTTVVIPMTGVPWPASTITKLCPALTINGKVYIALTQQLSAIDKSSLGKPVIDFSSHRHELIAAIDFLISGV